MSQYEISIIPINEASDKINLLVNRISEVSERLHGVQIDLPSSFNDIKRQINVRIESVDKHKSQTAKLSQALKEVSDIYKRAEQTAISSDVNENNTAGTPGIAYKLQRRANSGQGVILSRRLIMPDWLQMAVVEYEQSGL
ncbi:MAG: hypothetical protein FWD38_05615 [Oscillospiraceae bacterium]|nr:hypothetical protein [Oscillospiraceae bacterium]